MKRFKVRPYFGHDCDGHQGFNDGYYEDAIEVEANDEDEAKDKAMDVYVAEHSIDLSKVERDGHFGENTLYAETGYFDRDGNDLTKEEYDAIEDHEEAETNYRYQYVDFNDVEEI